MEGRTLVPLLLPSIGLYHLMRTMKNVVVGERWNVFGIKGEGTLNYILRWSLTSFVIGTASGVVVYLFKRGVFFFYQLPARELFVYAGPALGGLIIGLLFYRMEPGARGEGVPSYIRAVNEKGGFVPLRLTLLKYLAGLFTLGLGGSGGFVGPMALVNGGVGSFLARKLKTLSPPFSLRKEELDTATVCGVAGALGALLKAPLGGGIFAVEILYAASINYRKLFPAILSSALGYTMFGLITDFGPSWGRRPFSFRPSEIPLFLLAAILSGWIGLLFITIYEKVSAFFERVRISDGLKPALGGIGCGLLGLVVGIEVIGVGADTLKEILQPRSTFTTFALFSIVLLVLGKMATTALTIGSGGSAGFTFPSIMLGALAGDLVATSFGVTDSGMHLALIVVGIAGSLGAILNVPIASIVICIEMFGFNFGLPAILGGVIGYMVGRPKVIYDYTSITAKP